MMFMPASYFRLGRDTLAIANRDGKNVAVTVPRGACIRLGHVAEDSRLVDVEWEGQIVKMFVVDVYERGELVKAVS
jgi:hypothetical protein